MSKLYVVATPIGNLEDITLRALRVLKEADLMLCEDTRVTKKLLSHYDIETPTKRLDAHTEGNMAEGIKKLFEENNTIALVTDAGTPAISDPGDRFVAAVREKEISVESVPGASALTTALSVSGLPSSQFVFLGFLPHKKGRETLFKEIAEEKRMVVFYESPHRIEKTLTSLAAALEEREVVIARELTKMYEEIMCGTASEILKNMAQNKDKMRGEFVVMVKAL